MVLTELTEEMARTAKMERQDPPDHRELKEIRVKCQ